MPRFSANLSMLFREYAPLDRLRAAREAGFRAIEMQFPYDLDPGALAAAVREHGMAVSVINVPVGNFAAGGEGTAALPGRRDEFRAGVAAAKRLAGALGAASVNVLPGRPAPERDRDACLDALAANVAHAAGELADIGVGVVVEAVNDRDRPGVLLPRVDDVAALLDRVGHPNARLQFDLYHVAMMGDDIVAAIGRHAGRIGHVQFADAPGRHEPGTGGIDFAAAFAALDRSGYGGWCGAEYVPAGRTEDGLGWFSD